MYQTKPSIACYRLLAHTNRFPSTRSFRVKYDNNLSSLRTSSCGVPQGSVLGPLFFIMYITPLSTFSTLISSLSLDHNFYADDTRLFSSFPPTQLRLKHFSPSKRSSTPLSGWLLIFLLLTPLRLNSCSSDSETNLPKTQLFIWHLPLCSKPRRHLWTSYLFWPNHISLQSLLLSHSSTSMYPAYLDSSTACTIATSFVYSKHDYCNSL